MDVDDILQISLDVRQEDLDDTLQKTLDFLQEKNKPLLDYRKATDEVMQRLY